MNDLEEGLYNDEDPVCKDGKHLWGELQGDDDCYPAVHCERCGQPGDKKHIESVEAERDELKKEKELERIKCAVMKDERDKERAKMAAAIKQVETMIEYQKDFADMSTNTDVCDALERCLEILREKEAGS